MNGSPVPQPDGIRNPARSAFFCRKLWCGSSGFFQSWRRARSSVLSDGVPRLPRSSRNPGRALSARNSRPGASPPEERTIRKATGTTGIRQLPGFRQQFFGTTPKHRLSSGWRRILSTRTVIESWGSMLSRFSRADAKSGLPRNRSSSSATLAPGTGLAAPPQPVSTESDCGPSRTSSDGGRSEPHFLRGTPAGAGTRECFLADTAINANAAHQEMGHAGASVGPGLSGPDEHSLPPLSLATGSPVEPQSPNGS